MPASMSSRSVVRDGVRALASQTYPPYIHHSAPNTSSTRNPSSTVTSCDRIPVSWVMAKTKTRSKNSSRVLTRSGAPRPAAHRPVTGVPLCPGGTSRPAARPSGQLVGAGPRGRDVGPGADRVQHPAARRHQGALGIARGARVQQVGVVLPGPFGPYDLVPPDRSLGIAFRRRSPPPRPRPAAIPGEPRRPGPRPRRRPAAARAGCCSRSSTTCVSGSPNLALNSTTRMPAEVRRARRRAGPGTACRGGAWCPRRAG